MFSGSILLILFGAIKRVMNYSSPIPAFPSVKGVTAIDVNGIYSPFDLNSEMVQVILLSLYTSFVPVGCQSLPDGNYC